MFQQHYLETLLKEGYSIWLFTSSDLKTIVVPTTLFGLGCSLAASAFGFPPSMQPTVLDVVARLPAIVFWVWINLLPFTINNQIQPLAIAEDQINKPWRTMPSSRMSPARARIWMYIMYGVAIYTSLVIGGLPQCLSLIILGTWYNEMGGSDRHWIIRNLINSGGFVSFSSGATEVALIQPLFGFHAKGLRAQQELLEWPPRILVQWHLIVAAVIFSSVHSQDIPDVDGDRARGRNTVPITCGSFFARLTVAISVTFWSLACPYFWNSTAGSYLLVVALGGIVSLRSLIFNTVIADKKTFLIYNLWLVALYTLPVMVWYRS